MKCKFNIKKFLILNFAAMTSMVLLFGCIKHPLDQPVTGTYTTGNFWRNQSDVIAGVLGIYNELFTEDWIGHDLYAYDDQSDDISVDGDHSDFISIGKFNIDPTLQLIYITWPFAYEQISRANNSIYYIPKVPVMDSSIRQRSKNFMRVPRRSKARSCRWMRKPVRCWCGWPTATAARR